MRHFVALATLGLVVATGCSRQREREREREPGGAQQAYPFYFHESTGPNKYVLVDGVEQAIEFDHGSSNDAAVQALLSLNWNVLYPNSKGVIALIGTFHPDTHTFSLRHWFLPIPFQAYRGETTLEPGPLVWRDALERSDFSPALGDDPRVYQRASREDRSKP